MSKKSLILCLAALIVMIVGIGVAVMFLYSGSGSSKAAAPKVADESRYLLLPAVPSDAAAVFCYSDADDAMAGIFSPELVSAFLNKTAETVPVSNKFTPENFLVKNLFDLLLMMVMILKS